MSESNIKTETRANEMNFNRLSLETVEVYLNSFAYSSSASEALDHINASRPAITANEQLNNTSLRGLVIRGLHIVAHIRKEARYTGYAAWKSSGSANTIHTNFFVSGKQFNDAWHTHFLSGLREIGPLPIDADQIDWSDGVADTTNNEIADLVRYWAYVKGNVYSNLHDQIKATEKITADVREDYDIALKMLSVDAFEEWLNEYLDALAQSQKALLNLGAAKLQNLSRTDLTSLFNDDVNIPKAMLELVQTSYTDTFQSFSGVLGNFDYSDLITRTNVSELYDLYNQDFLRPSTSLNNAQKYFGMNTFDDKLGVKRNFMNLISMMDEGDISNAKVGYDLNFYLRVLEVFYGPGEYNIADNRIAFLNSNIHWSAKAYDKIFDKQFYTKTSVKTMKGLCDSNIYPALSMAVGARFGNPVVANSTGMNGKYINYNNYIARSEDSFIPVLATSAEDYKSAIRIDQAVHDYNENDIAMFIHIKGMVGATEVSSDSGIPVKLHGVVRTINNEFVNVIVPNGDSVMDTDLDRQGYLYLETVDDDTELSIGYPEIVDITNLTAYMTAGGFDLTYTNPFTSEIGTTSFYILNCFNRDTRKALYIMGNAGRKSESKASASVSDNDNDNDNDGDDSS